MLYNPQRSKKGALYFVGRRAKAPEHDSGKIQGPILLTSTYTGYWEFIKAGDGTMKTIRKEAAKDRDGARLPQRPQTLGTNLAPEGEVKPGTSIFTQTYLAHMGGKKRLYEEDSQKALLSFADECEANPWLVEHAYEGNKAPLDYSEVEGDGNKMLKGDFCRKCGQKVCKCVDYRILPKRRRADGTIIPNLEYPKPMPATDRGIGREKNMEEIEVAIMQGRMNEDDEIEKMMK